MVAAVLAVTACNPATDGGPPVVKAFGAQGWGALKPGMTEQDALATGELDREPVAVVAGCEFYSLAGGPKPDPAWIAADQAYDQAHRAAVNRVEDLTAKLGPPPAPDAPEADQVAWVARSAETARAVGDVAIAASELNRRADEVAGPTSTVGIASFRDDKLRLIGGPRSARTVDGIGPGSSVEDLRKTYLGRGLALTSPGRYEMPARGRAGWVLDFDFAGSDVVYLRLRDANAKCA